MSNTYNSDNPDEILPLPLDGWHRARGARMVPFAGYAMPVQYEGIVAEHLWCRENAGLFDVSHMGQLQLVGEGAAQALEALCPGDITALKPGKMRYSLLLDEDGGILDDMMVTNTGHHLYLVVNGAMKWDDIGFLREHLPDEITLRHDEDAALLALQGPKAALALARIGIGPAQPGWPVPSELHFMEAGPFLWGEVSLGISRSGYTGEDGFEISVPAEHAETLVDALCAQPEVKPAGLGARDSLRLEAGLPLYGHDMDVDKEPVEANASFAISKRRRLEGGFNGAARILKSLAQGPSQRLVGLAVEGKMALREGTPLFASDQQIGMITSGCFSPSLGVPIAMGYVASAHTAPGSSLVAESRGKRIPVRVTPLPFQPHRYHRKGAKA